MVHIYVSCAIYVGLLYLMLKLRDEFILGKICHVDFTTQFILFSFLLISFCDIN